MGKIQENIAKSIEAKQKKKETTFPAYERVKNDILESRRSANKWFSIYIRKKKVGMLNDAALKKFFSRFTSEVINLYNFMRPYCATREFDDLLEIDEYLLHGKDFKRDKWIDFWNRLNELIYDIGISQIEAMQDIEALEDKEYSELLEYEQMETKG